jgi:hypothetical protein
MGSVGSIKASSAQSKRVELSGLEKSTGAQEPTNTRGARDLTDAGA